MIAGAAALAAGPTNFFTGTVAAAFGFLLSSGLNELCYLSHYFDNDIFLLIRLLAY